MSEDGVIRMSPLDRSLRRRTKPAWAKKLEAAGIHTVRDLLWHYPRKLVDPAQRATLTELEEGKHVVLALDVAQFTARRMRNRRGFLVQVYLTDGVDQLTTVYFAPHQGRVSYLEGRLKVGRRVVIDGKVHRKNNEWQVIHPRIDVVESGLSEEEIAQDRTRLQVRYASVRGIASDDVGKLIQAEMDFITDLAMPDPVPPQIREELKQFDHATAMRTVHRPDTPQDYHRALRTLKFEEAFVLQAAMAQRRAQAESEDATARPPLPGGILDAFDAQLPFTLTTGQAQIGEVITADLARSAPMHRLLQGEVGSGKTVVALRAMLQVVDAGGQAALLAPTEVLAAQHDRSIRDLLGRLGEAGMLGSGTDATRVVLLTGGMPAAQRRAALAEIAAGTAGIVVGTHALLEDVVQFADLGLVVVDEQHRFGVEQRDILRSKGRTSPHLLVMTATPIPRTVAMTIFGDLEISTLREVPAGRAEVTTHVVEPGMGLMSRMWERLAEEVAKGGRAYVVCPRISASVEEPDNVIFFPGAEPDEPDDDGEAPRDLESVESVGERLRTLPQFADIAIGTLHGRMTPEAKEAAMAAFASGATPVLVSTTVIEVGVDVPEATAMVILDADRFGLSQLHQLRGRIGRGSQPGICFAVTPASLVSPMYERLVTFSGTRDGFKLAEADLELRREGDVLGAAQHGKSSGLRLLRVVTDQKVIAQARDAARAVVGDDPTLARNPALVEAIDRALEGEREEFLERT